MHLFTFILIDHFSSIVALWGAKKISKTNTNKGVTKELGTFLSWGKEEIIGYGTFEQQGKQYVNKIWCKICIILSKLKGAAKKSA